MSNFLQNQSNTPSWTNLFVNSLNTSKKRVTVNTSDQELNLDFNNLYLTSSTSDVAVCTLPSPSSDNLPLEVSITYIENQLNDASNIDITSSDSIVNSDDGSLNSTITLDNKGASITLMYVDGSDSVWIETSNLSATLS